MVLKSMCLQIKEIYQIILDLTSRKIIWGIQIIKIAPGGEIITYVGIEVSKSLKAREMPAGKLPPRKDGSSLGRKCVCNYRSAVGMLSCFQGSTRPEIAMAVHHCARFQ